MQKKTTQKGTLKSRIMACTMDTNIHSRPAKRVMIGKVVSMVEAPPQEMAANGPRKRTRSGVNRRVRISRMMLLIRATVPSSAPLYWVMKMDESE